MSINFVGTIAIVAWLFIGAIILGCAYESKQNIIRWEVQLAMDKDLIEQVAKLTYEVERLKED